MFMISQNQIICFTCRVQLERLSTRHKYRLPWLPSRFMAQMRKRAPSRMSLSPKVAQPLSKSLRTKDKKAHDSPFGGMNITEARLPERSRQYEVSDRQNAVLKGRETQAEKKRDQKGKRNTSNELKALKMQRALTGLPYARRTQIKSTMNKIESFEDFSLLPIIQSSISTQGLKGMDDRIPTPIQKLAIPALLGRKGRERRQKSASTLTPNYEQYLLAAETGSGKTLAYLLPVIDAIKRAEIEENKSNDSVEDESEWDRKKRSLDANALEPPDTPPPSFGKPRALVLVPSAELANQIGAVFKLFSHTVKYKAQFISASFSVTVIRNKLFSPNGIDILISTPHLLSSIAETEPNILSRVSHLVIDEADSLFDRSFAPLTSGILDRTVPSLKQLILCSATIPRSLDTYLNKRFPDITRLVTPKLHAIPRRVQLTVVDAVKDPYRGNKDLACADTIWSIGRAGYESQASNDDPKEHRSNIKSIIVFVNERDKSVELVDYLSSKGIDAVALSRDATDRNNNETLAALTSREGHSQSTSDDAPELQLAFQASGQPKRTLKNTKVLVATDLGSRGIDTLAVRNVILYDVPFTTIDFIHRLGRVGRMGRRGRGYVIVGRQDRRDIVREVQDSMYKGQALI